MVKDNKKELEAILGTEKDENQEKQLPKYAYLRMNKLKHQEEDDSSDDSSSDSSSSSSSSSSSDNSMKGLTPLEKAIKTLKKQGYKTARVCDTNILQVKNKKDQKLMPIAQHSLVKSG